MRFRSRTALLLLSCWRPSIKSGERRRAAAAAGNSKAGYNILLVFLLQQVLIAAAAAGAVTASAGGTKGLQRMRAAKVAHVHGLQAVPESLSINKSLTKDKQSRYIDDSNHLAGKYEIRSVSGEPNYKSVNLTWEVEFVPSADIDAITNSSAEVEPPKAFQIFFCELQSFGPHRCRSKLVNETQQLEPNGNDDNNHNSNNHKVSYKNNNGEDEQAKSSRQVRHYAVQIENLRMATKYSFHIRPQAKRRNMKITGRSELFGNEIDDEAKGVPLDGGQTIIIPTKGFAAQATKCLPQASEIEVETGPYFGGKIVVDGGNCGIKGDQNDPTDRYTMRIDHKMCGSLVKPETNTVETFITVQEKLGIYTHSTRRFVVVCSFQSGMQTVRASFTVPGSDGVAAAVENDPFEPDDRLGREQRYMRFVDKSALVLKENAPLEPIAPAAHTHSLESDESIALVQEVTEAANVSSERSVDNELLTVDSSDVPNSVALLEDIVPGVNEQHIKHENVMPKLQEIDEQHEHDAAPTVPVMAARAAKYAKLVREQAVANLLADEANTSGTMSVEQWYHLHNKVEGRGFATTLEHISSNAGSIIITVSLCVIVLGIFVFVVFREARRQRYIRSNIKMQQLHSSRASSSTSLTASKAQPGKRTMPRALQAQLPQGSM
uniref:ZP domain-containing protein n=1 Tax=Bactrocera latifrons TaxID=174628 RepID=A0A0K8U6F0_BACLA